jgi:hypothetical protein
MRDLVARFKIPDEPPPARPRQGAAPAGRTPLPKAEPKPRPRPLPKRPMATQAVGADDEWKEF